MSTESLASATRSKTYASFVENIELGAAGQLGAPCRRIRVNAPGGGALSVRYADGTTDTITGLQQGDQLDVIVAAILSAGTTVASVTAFR